MNTDPDRGFTLIEVIIALVILGIGVIALLRLFPTGVQRAAESERLTRATLLAQEIMEAIKAEGGAGLVPVIPGPNGKRESVPMPGDGVDDDEDGLNPDGTIIHGLDLNRNGVLDSDYDGLPESEYTGRLCRDGVFCLSSAVMDGVDSDLDGLIDDDGDSNFCGHTWVVGAEGIAPPHLPDGDMNYDPEIYMIGGYYIGVDEEYPDGIDNDTNGIDLDGDGQPDLTIDEDVRLASNYHERDPIRPWRPLEAGDNVDNDGDGESNSPVDPDGHSIADGLDNNGNGMIDEGIDEEVYNGIDDDGDGETDEDCRASCYPFTPRKFFRLEYIDDDGDGRIDEDPVDGIDNDGDGLIDEDPPNDDTDQFGWQIIVARVPDGGSDGIDNDGDGQTDEEWRDGLNDDPPCSEGSFEGDDLIDEDCKAAPVRGYRRVTIRITWDGDGDQNGDGVPGVPGDDDHDGGADFNDPEIKAAMKYEALILGISPDSPILRERWAQDDDEDGRIDEEKPNGIDDDLDGLIDEDVAAGEFLLTGFVQL